MPGEALSRSYGCFFAEFLGEPSLVRLGLLDLTTCVGLRYGYHTFKLRSFSWERAPYNLPWTNPQNLHNARCLMLSGFAKTATSRNQRKSNNTL